MDKNLANILLSCKLLKGLLQRSLMRSCTIPVTLSFICPPAKSMLSKEQLAGMQT